MACVFYKKVEGRTYAAPQYGKEITLKVGKDIEERGAVAISKEAMAELGILEGEVVEIIGAWTQKAKVIPSTEQDMTIIRMDKEIRGALPVDIGQEVGIRKEYI